MKKHFLTFYFSFCSVILFGQVTNNDSITNEPLNTADNIISGNGGRITVSGYGQIDYNQPFGNEVFQNGKMDVHRLITFFGYQFAAKTFFVTELEVEHANEMYVEQAFLQQNINSFLNFRAGLILIPMGIVNEYHEPTTFNGVERPNLDGKIIPTTWRELGAGFTGKLSDYSIKYQAYLTNGFLSYNGNGILRGIDGYRKGRQKGIQSIISSPNLSTKIDFYGVKGLKIGLAGYFGKTQTTAIEGISKNDDVGILTADSTRIGISMLGADFRYQHKGFQARGQFIHSKNTNVKAYNTKTNQDLGSSFLGYYLEAGYDILRLFKKDIDQELTLFMRYENYDTHHTTYDELVRNLAYNRNDITCGFGLKLANGAVLKLDYQRFTNMSNTNQDHQINAGVAVWF